MTEKNIEKSDQKTNKLIDEFHQNRLAIFMQSSGFTVATMAFLGGGGYLLDKQLGSSPAFFIAGLVIAFPLTMFLLFRKFKKYATNITEKYKK